MYEAPAPLFEVHRWVLPATTRDYPVLAVAQAEQGAEYWLPAPDSYRRYYREPDRLLPVTDAERAMLDGCVATFAELAAQYGALLRQPLPPRYRQAGRRGPDQDN